MSTPILSDNDLLELISLQEKASWEGSLSYAVENWHWRFESPELSTALADRNSQVLHEAMRVHAAAIHAWWEAHSMQEGADLINAHRARHDAARQAATE